MQKICKTAECKNRSLLSQALQTFTLQTNFHQSVIGRPDAFPYWANEQTIVVCGYEKVSNWDDEVLYHCENLTDMQQLFDAAARGGGYITWYKGNRGLIALATAESVTLLPLSSDDGSSPVQLDQQALLDLIALPQKQIDVIKFDEVTYSSHPDGLQRVDTRFLIGISYIRKKKELGIIIIIDGQENPEYETVLSTPLSLHQLLTPQLIAKERANPNGLRNIIVRLVREIDQEERSNKNPAVLQ